MACRSVIGTQCLSAAHSEICQLRRYSYSTEASKNAALSKQQLRKKRTRLLVRAEASTTGSRNVEIGWSPANERQISTDETSLSQSLNAITLLNPLRVSNFKELKAGTRAKTLLVYVPGMDCTGHGIRPQLPSLIAAGYDVRSVYIPSADRSSWSELVNILIPLLQNEARSYEQVILLGESFGGRLALHLALAAGSTISQLVLVNPATNLRDSNIVASLFGQIGVLGLFPETLYGFAQDILLPLLVRHTRVSRSSNEDLLSPVDFVPADCAAYRLSMLNEAGPSDKEIRSIKTPTLILSSAKDRLISSLNEGVRLQNLIPNAKRVILPDSGHMALLEDSLDLTTILKEHIRPTQDLHPRPSDCVPDNIMDELGTFLTPWRFLTSPFVSGAENLPSPSETRGRPVLFVGNHTLFGAYDSAMLVHELYLRGFKCRSLAHPGHWKSPVGSLFERYGSVKVSKFEAYRLLKDGQHVLLFPGGAREVWKLKGEEYKLLWKPTADFVRMAARLNAFIVPFGALGGDEAFKILLDSQDLLNSPAGGLIRQIQASLDLDPNYVSPISALPFTDLPSPIPLPYTIERIYFHFADCIDTAKIGINIQDREECLQLYNLVKERVEKSILLLKLTREADPERELGDRLLAKLQRLLPVFRKKTKAKTIIL